MSSPLYTKTILRYRCGHSSETKYSKENSDAIAEPPKDKEVTVRKRLSFDCSDCLEYPPQKEGRGSTTMASPLKEGFTAADLEREEMAREEMTEEEMTGEQGMSAKE
jgi:hypothetical protein